MLFILVMDRAVRAAILALGVELGGNRVDALAYEDDLLLFTERPERLQEKLDGLE